MHKHDAIAAGWAGVVMGPILIIIGAATNNGWVELIGAIAFFGGLLLLKDV